MQRTRYDFWHEWSKPTGQLYAELHTFDSVAEARKSHTGALGFHWARGLHRPSVSDLYAVTTTKDEATGRSRLDGRVSIAEGARHETPATLT